MTHLLQSGREPFPIANERHLMDQADIIFHVIHHIGESVFFHWAKVKEKSISNVGGSASKESDRWPIIQNTSDLLRMPESEIKINSYLAAA
jgi:hypothetical protein